MATPILNVWQIFAKQVNFLSHIFDTTYNLSSELHLAKFNCFRKQLLIIKSSGAKEPEKFTLQNSSTIISQWNRSFTEHRNNISPRTFFSSSLVAVKVKCENPRCMIVKFLFWNSFGFIGFLFTVKIFFLSLQLYKWKLSIT